MNEEQPNLQASAEGAREAGAVGAAQPYRVIRLADLAAYLDEEARRAPPPDLDAIAARAAAATEGPWCVVREDPEFGTIGMPVVQLYFDEALVVGHRHDWGPTAPPLVDAAFIAAARTDVPALVAEVRRLRALLGVT